MAQDFEQTLKDIFGDSLGRLTQFQRDQAKRVMDKAHEVARAAVQDDLTKLAADIADLRTRVARLEEDRISQAAESVEGSI
jgi:hypothetical protein